MYSLCRGLIICSVYWASASHAAPLTHTREPHTIRARVVTPCKSELCNNYNAQPMKITLDIIARVIETNRYHKSGTCNRTYNVPP